MNTQQQYKFPQYIVQPDGYRTNCPYCGSKLDPVEDVEIVSQYCEHCALPINNFQLGLEDC